MDPLQPNQVTDGDDLRLAVLDSEDLAVVSAHLQNAQVSRPEMVFRPAEMRFAMVVSRFDWSGAARGQFMRCRTGVHFERVSHVARNSAFERQGDAGLQLLAIAFLATDPPSGNVLLTFTDGAQIRLTVECLEAEMRDLGPRWSVEGRPEHPGDRSVAGERTATSA